MKEVRLLKSLCPDELPVGSIGEMIVENYPGLSLVKFGDKGAYLYPNEYKEEWNEK